LNESKATDPPEDDIRKKEIKRKISEVCKAILIHEGIPACAIIPNDTLDYLINGYQKYRKRENTEAKRLDFLKKRKSFFAKWDK
jgi:hypothetical protein